MIPENIKVELSENFGRSAKGIISLNSKQIVSIHTSDLSDLSEFKSFNTLKTLKIKSRSSLNLKYFLESNPFSLYLLEAVVYD